MPKTSVIFVHWAMNDERSTTMQVSLLSLIETTRHLPVEIIVVDNGSSLGDSSFLLELTQRKDIQYYVRNSENLYFGYARNQGVALSCGDYLVFSDNDIEYRQGWLEKAIAILEANPDRKIAVTPLRADRQHRHLGYWKGELEFEGEKYLINTRAGSNSWVMRKKDFEIVGRFRNHRIAGSHWADTFVNKGYLMVTMEKAPLSVSNKNTTPLATDLGFKSGYNIKAKPEIAKVFANGERMVINN